MTDLSAELLADLRVAREVRSGGACWASNGCRNATKGAWCWRHNPLSRPDLYTETFARLDWRAEDIREEIAQLEALPPLKGDGGMSRHRARLRRVVQMQLYLGWEIRRAIEQCRLEGTHVSPEAVELADLGWTYHERLGAA